MFDFRAAVVAARACLVGAAVVAVGHTVAVRIRAAAEGCCASNVRAGVAVVGHTVVVTVGHFNRASVVGGRSGFRWATVIAVGYTVAVCVRTAFKDAHTFFVGAQVVEVHYTVAVCVGAASVRGQAGDGWAAVAFVGNAVAVAVQRQWRRRRHDDFLVGTEEQVKTGCMLPVVKAFAFGEVFISRGNAVLGLAAEVQVFGQAKINADAEGNVEVKNLFIEVEGRT